VNVIGAPDIATLTRLGAMASAGELEVPIDEVYPLERVAEAIAKFTSGKSGKIVLAVADVGA
jgi:NADPH:quinone reductase-like Zn-dependent oxidoreductase